MNKALSKEDLKYLEICLTLAEEAVEAGDKAFGSILVDANGDVLAKARNRVFTQHPLAHPEYELAHWAAEHLSTEERKKATIYTTGEHCPMCSGAQAWAGIGTIVYLSSGQQLEKWMEEFGADEMPINLKPVEEIIKNVIVRGPGEGEMLERIKMLHKRVLGL